MLPAIGVCILAILGYIFVSIKLGGSAASAYILGLAIGSLSIEILSSITLKKIIDKRTNRAKKHNDIGYIIWLVLGCVIVIATSCAILYSIQ